ncbi:MAG: glycosyltransferase family 1 protein [Ignavibacteriaceae bacterium]
MNIGIDARLLERKITGIGRVLINYLNEIPLYDKRNKYFLFSYGPINCNPSFYRNITTSKSKFPQKLFAPIWNNLILPFYLRKYKIDILFSVNQILPLIKIKNCKYVFMVHDVIYKADPDFLPLIYRKYLQFFAYFSTKICDKILTVSEYSKKDILKHYNISEEKIKVILSSINPDFKPLNLTESEKSEFKRVLKLPETIVLYVGMIENRKNIYGLLKIADIVRIKKADVEFVLVGKKGYGSKKIFKAINKRPNVKYLSDIDDKTLKKLYNIADVFLFPSFYEGFGYPPIEAMQSGLPVVTSKNTSLIEIVNSGGIMHDVKDIELMANDVLKLIEDREYHQLIKNKGIERIKRFNQNNPAKELVDIFNSFNSN